jgi:hypothetical protein
MQQVFTDVRVLDAYGTFRAWAQKANGVDPELETARPGDWLSSDGCESFNVRDQMVGRSPSTDEKPNR